MQLLRTMLGTMPCLTSDLNWLEKGNVLLSLGECSAMVNKRLTRLGQIRMNALLTVCACVAVDYRSSSH